MGPVLLSTQPGKLTLIISEDFRVRVSLGSVIDKLYLSKRNVYPVLTNAISPTGQTYTRCQHVASTANQLLRQSPSTHFSDVRPSCHSWSVP